MMIADQVRSAFPFAVNTYPLSGPDNMRTPHYGLFRDDSGECVGSAVKKGYEPHTTEDIVTLVEAAQHVFSGDSQVTCHWRKGHYVSVSPSKEHRLAVFGTSDNIFPRLIIHGGYDGTCFSASCGFYRDACKNLAILKSVGEVAVKIKHTIQLRNRMDELVEKFAGLQTSWEATQATILQMEQRKVAIADFLTELFPVNPDAEGRSKTIAKNRIMAIVNRLAKEHQQTGRQGSWKECTAYQAYQAVHGYCLHDKSRKSNPSLFDRAIMAWDDPIVESAERLALAM